MNNSLFGKTMANIRYRVKINYNGRKIFSKTLAAVHMRKTKTYFNKPIYLGMAILEISKEIMYNFHYGVIKKMYGEKAKLLFTDTVSLCYEIETQDYYKDISPFLEQHFDTSGFPKNHPSDLQSGLNKKVLGMFKDEIMQVEKIKNEETEIYEEKMKGEILEFCGLRSKLYGLNFEKKEVNDAVKCKGISKTCIKNCIRFDQLKDVLFSEKPQMREMKQIRSINHNLFLQNLNKVALSGNDDKRVIKKIKFQHMH